MSRAHNARRVPKRALPRLRILSTAAAIAALMSPISIPTARADGPGVGTPWIVSVGDSYISGEAGRWAGNTNRGESYHDALGSTAYYDGGTAERIRRCHRSKAAEVFIGGGVSAMNLACSGAKTWTVDRDSNGYFKPGLDFYSDTSGRKGQARMLQDFATTHNVRMIPLSIGGNNFNFADIIKTCVANYLGSSSSTPNYCHDDAAVTNNFTPSTVTARTTAIKDGILKIRQAMRYAGYADSAYTILVQNYESPIPNGTGFRYSQTNSRQWTGGCGLWNADANWANSTALPAINNAVRNAVSQTGLSNVKMLDLSRAFNGRRLCENTVGLLEEKGLPSWKSAGAADKTEWINHIRTVSTATGNYYIQESFHPNYWGELALRNCVRRAYNGGSPRGGTCTIAGSGLTSRGEPIMALS